MTVEPQEIHIDGTLLKMHVCHPDSEHRNGAAVVMLAGLSGTMDSSLAPFAEAICETGTIAIMFDYRHFGLSGGQPRQFLSVSRQLRDATAVIQYARQRSDVDENNIGLWSSSFGGGLGVHTAVTDGKIKALVSQCPMLDSRRTTKMSFGARSRSQNTRLKLLALWAYAVSIFGFRGPMIPITDPGGFCVLPSDESHKFHLVGGQLWRNELTLQSFLRGDLHLNHPLSVADKLNLPTLIQICDRDQTISNAGIHEFIAKADKYVSATHYDCGHFDIYLAPHRAPAAKEAAEFLATHLHA